MTRTSLNYRLGEGDSELTINLTGCDCCLEAVAKLVRDHVMQEPKPRRTTKINPKPCGCDDA